LIGQCEEVRHRGGGRCADLSDPEVRGPRPPTQWRTGRVRAPAAAATPGASGPAIPSRRG